MGKMIKEFKIKNKNVQVFYESPQPRNLPVIILNTFGYDGKTVYNKCKELKCKEFILIAISGLEWNNEMTPWYAKKLNEKDNSFLGKADEYIKILESNIIPIIKDYIENILKVTIDFWAIAGYSLGGLFAIYSIYKTNLFSRIVSASGSFWFPKFIEFVKENKIITNVEKIYFSLGNKESKVKNKVLSTVENNTKKLVKLYKDKGIKVLYEVNEGNHFQNIELRIAKGIIWILE